MIKAFFTVNNKERFVEIPNMDSVTNSSDILKAEGCMSRMLGLSIYDVKYKRYESINNATG